MYSEATALWCGPNLAAAVLGVRLQGLRHVRKKSLLEKLYAKQTVVTLRENLASVAS